jgi:hypothetical protein
MTVDTENHSGSHPDPNLACQQAVEGPLQEILADAKTKGWGTIETLSAMEEVLKQLRLAWEKDPNAASETDPDPTNDWPAADPFRTRRAR